MFSNWECPDFIGEHGRKLWSDVGPILVKSGIMAESDKTLFALLCQTFHMMLRFQEIVRAQGFLIDDARGSEKKHPLLTAISQQTNLFKGLCLEFGMSPSSRSRLGFTIDDTSGDDAVWEKFNRKREQRQLEKDLD